MRIALLLLLILTSGCAHKRLKHTFVKQANGLTYIYEEQVLDNLAMFLTNPDSVPHFVVADSGGTLSSENGGLSGTAPLNPFFNAIGFSVDTGNQVDWVLGPVKDATRLRLMRCAYQKAICYHCDPCSNCSDLETSWTGVSKEDRLANAQCDIQCDWLCVGSRKDVPKDCRSFGEYCGKCVWAKPGHENELAKLVFTILEYATGDPAAGESVVTKEVTIHVDDQGFPVPSDDAVMKIVANVPIGVDPTDTRALLGLPLRYYEVRDAERPEIEAAEASVADPPPVPQMELDVESDPEMPPVPVPEDIGPADAGPAGRVPPRSIVPSPYRTILDPEKVKQLRGPQPMKSSVRPYDSPGRLQIRGGR